MTTGTRPETSRKKEVNNALFVRIRSAPQDQIRNDQVGDWQIHGDHHIEVTVLETLSPESQLAIAIHELIEAWRCREDKIPDGVVCAFDEQYKAECKEGKHGEYDEPGDDPRSPYREQHADAIHVERAVCSAIGLNWKEHCLLEPGSEGDHQKMESPASSQFQLHPELPRHGLD